MVLHKVNGVVGNRLLHGYATRSAQSNKLKSSQAMKSTATTKKTSSINLTKAQVETFNVFATSFRDNLQVGKRRVLATHQMDKGIFTMTFEKGQKGEHSGESSSTIFKIFSMDGGEGGVGLANKSAISGNTEPLFTVTAFQGNETTSIELHPGCPLNFKEVFDLVYNQVRVSGLYIEGLQQAAA